MLPWQTGSEPFSVMTQQQLYEWITHPELLNRDTLYELRTLLARYPYFQTVRLLYLKNLFLLHDITFGEELRKAALYVADRKVLFYLIEGERFIISPLDKQEKHTINNNYFSSFLEFNCNSTPSIFFTRGLCCRGVAYGCNSRLYFFLIT